MSTKSLVVSKISKTPPFTLRDLKRRSLKLASKWAYGDKWGWAIGTFKKMSTVSAFRNHFVIKWEDGMETYWPKSPNSEYGSDQKWVLIRPQ